MAPRGRGGKFSKPSRGGGKHFSRDVQPVDKDGNPVGLWRDPEEGDADTSSEEESGSESSSEEESDDAGTGPSQPSTSEMTREERRAAAKAKKQAAIAKRNQKAAAPGDLPPSEDEDEEDDSEQLPANPNHTAKSRSQLEKTADDPAPVKERVKDLSQLSRREREAIQAQQARERYLKMHAEGKTDEARADLARLAIVREQREAERARKQAEKEEKEELARQREAAVKEREEKLRNAAMGKQKKAGKKN